MVFWCGGGLFSAPEAVQREKVGKIGKRLFLIGFQRDVREFFGAISWHGVLVWRRAVFSTGGSTTGKGWQNWQKAIFNRVSKGTLETFLVRFRGVSVLHCHGVLVWRKAVFSTGFNTTGKGWESAIFFIGFQRGVREFFGAISWLVRSLHCHGVLVWQKAVFSTRFNTR